MAIIYECKNFVVEAVEKPHVDRDDGGGAYNDLPEIKGC